jgi:hypothetical protein
MVGIYDVTEAFDDLYEPVVVITKSAGTYINGNWAPGPDVRLNVEAVIHPMSENQINKLTLDGYQGGELLRFYLIDTIVADITYQPAIKPGDMIEYKDELYTALKTEDWKHIGGYSVYYGERKK